MVFFSLVSFEFFSKILYFPKLIPYVLHTLNVDKIFINQVHSLDVRTVVKH